MRADPDLVHRLEGPGETFGELARLPPPQADRVAVEKESWSCLLSERREHIGVDADEVDREGRPHRVGLVLVLLAARRGGEADCGHRHVYPLQRLDHLPCGLADAEFGAEVPGDVDPHGRIRRLGRLVDVLLRGGVHGVR
jgi:hypothetical protein